MWVTVHACTRLYSRLCGEGWRRVTRAFPRVVRGTRTLGAIVFSYRHSFVTRGQAEVRLYCCHKDLGFLSRSFFLARSCPDVVSIERTVSRFTQISGGKRNLSASSPLSLFSSRSRRREGGIVWLVLEFDLAYLLTSCWLVFLWDGSFFFFYLCILWGEDLFCSRFSNCCKFGDNGFWLMDHWRSRALFFMFFRLSQYDFRFLRYRSVKMIFNHLPWIE